MLTLTMMLITTLIITNIIMMIAMIISKKSFSDREKTSPFECGFDPKNSARLPFSMQFFLITMIFLIFDVEITLILPMISSMNLSNMVNFSLTAITFILILIIGTYHEWNQGALNWKT